MYKYGGNLLDSLFMVEVDIYLKGFGWDLYFDSSWVVFCIMVL